MSSHETRSEIIREYLPKLIKSLTGFADDDENLRQCEQFAWSIIRNHRNLSTNSHEVRRKIEGIQEKFDVDNFGEYAKHLGRLCNEIIEHPLCVEHYEVDVHWSLLDLLLSLAYNPTGALRRNKPNINLSPQTSDACAENVESIESDVDYLKNELREDFIPLSHFSESDSELSNWSDESVEQVHGSCSENEIEKEESVEQTTSPVVPPSGLQNIKPPEKVQPFVLFDGTDSEKRLRNSVQHSWWLEGLKKHHPDIESTSLQANFALAYNHFLNEKTKGLHLPEPETATEYSLMREIFWMFQNPQTCKFFQVNGNEIKVRENVALPSTTAIGIASMLEEHFLPYIRMMSSLNKFQRSIYDGEDFTPPRTLECYAASLKLLLEPIWSELLKHEKRLIDQKNFEFNTIISLQYHLRATFAKLSNIYKIHEQSVLNLRQYPAHISTAYLLAGLIHCHHLSSTATESNLSISLFLASVKVFCIIIDTWWTEGRLDDWQNEFIVERTSETDQSICVRQFVKNKDKAFFVPTNISKMITENSFFQLLLEHSLEAGCTLNLLYEINRIAELRSACNVIEDKLYNVFIDDVLKYVGRFQLEPKTSSNEASNDTDASADNATGTGSVDASDVEDVKCDDNSPADCADGGVDKEFDKEWKALDNPILSKLTTNDEFLLLAFSMNMNLSSGKPEESEDVCDAEIDAFRSTINDDINALYIFENIEQSTHILPLEEVILNCLSCILKRRIAFANSFVMRLYREEFDILKHLRNIRKILLLEASDIMHQFYDKLFKQIELGDTWANPFLLTTQLDDIICAKFPEMSSLFRVEINSSHRCQTTKVYEAVDELSLNYNFSNELAHVITQTDIEEYNKVFRFLLKVKWGLIVLESLQFPRSYKRNTPYAPFEMIDLLMRRLQQLRFWMMYAMQSIHFHLMTHVLHSMGQQLDEKIVNCRNLKEMVTVHRSYVSTVCEHCFLVEGYSAIKLGVEQLLNLSYILRLEWNSCVRYIEKNEHPLAIVDLSETVGDNDYVANSQIDAIELTYIRCHQYLANKLNNEVYLKQQSFLLGLSAAFNTSLPY